MSRYFTKERILALIIIIFTLAIYAKALTFGFVNWDDFSYILRNDNVQNGLTWGNIKWAFTTYYASNWHPLTWLSHMLDFEIYGLHPSGHHIVSVFFHLANSLLIFFFFKIATGAVWRSFFIGLIFAIHPLHVESVTWVSERKDVLSAFFWFLTMVLYLRYVKQRSFKNYILVLFPFIMGLLSKPMVVTLPFTLLLIDYWPLGRIKCPDSKFFINLKEILVEKIPLFLLTLASCIITYNAQLGAMTTLDNLPFSFRLINSIISYANYILKFFFPVNLSYIYQHPANNYSINMLALAILVLLFFSVLFIISFNKRPFLLIGWLWFLGTLIPVIGLVQVGSQSMADRYAYIPSIGIFLIFIWSLAEIKNSVFQKFIVLFSCVSISFMSFLAWNQVDVWKNSRSLFTHAVEIDPNNFRALTYLGQELTMEGKLEEALSNCKSALKVHPSFAEAYGTIGSIYMMKKMYNEAIQNLEVSIKLKPDLSSARMTLSKVYLLTKQKEKAITVMTEGESIWGKNSWNLNFAGIAWSELGRKDKALENFEKALALRPSAPETMNNLAAFYLNEGDSKQARQYLEKALEISPLNPEILNNYGKALFMEGKFDDAIYSYLLALRVKPDYMIAKINLNQAIVSSSELLKKSH